MTIESPIALQRGARAEVVDLLATAVFQLLVTGWNPPGPASASVPDPLPSPPEVPHARP